MPEVGLERDSGSWEHWEVAETCRFRANPVAVLASPRRKVWTLSTPAAGTGNKIRPDRLNKWNRPMNETEQSKERLGGRSAQAP
ncbi:hypothetical protein J3A64_001665 [Pseudarthrobacter sp. PvP004]|nr:hypothetical protein [Pseudarthrobacter sp. PvP004]